MIETYVHSARDTMDHGIQIPGVVQNSQSSVHLSLTVDSNLVVNEQYSAVITVITSDGEIGQNVTKTFGMYCISSVHRVAAS